MLPFKMQNKDKSVEYRNIANQLSSDSVHVQFDQLWPIGYCILHIKRLTTIHSSYFILFRLMALCSFRFLLWHHQLSWTKIESVVYSSYFGCSPFAGFVCHVGDAGRVRCESPRNSHYSITEVSLFIDLQVCLDWCRLFVI